ncbi:MAG: rod shape-determining protein MreB [Clostridiales bacterium]|nr:rod shape-determining protein MreB [Clostridiales bacterium]
MFGIHDMAVDLGTSSVLVYVKGKGIVLKEPSVVAINKNNNQVLAVGSEAKLMLGRTPGNIVATRPLREGVISDYDTTQKMLKYFIRKVSKYTRLSRPRIIICIPTGITQVEQKAVLDASYDAGANKTYLMEEPIAAAIGAGIDISLPNGSMVVDIGGGTTDIAVISLGGAVVSDSIKVAGDKFDDAIIRYMRRKYNILIGEKTAEDLKITVGAIYPSKEQKSMEICGRNLISGLPKVVNVTTDEMVEALKEPADIIVEAIHSVLERTPPELSSDISERGIIMTGGGALLTGMDKLIQEQTGIPVYVASDPISCVVLGAGKALENISVYSESALMDNSNSPVYIGS